MSESDCGLCKFWLISNVEQGSVFGADIWRTEAETWPRGGREFAHDIMERCGYHLFVVLEAKK